ncbi:MAG: hypothetical protein M1465_02765 [Candidatus Marsarchaeota archaeon]|nr:hypothetical protein [Candidatus Marsarchaeota archaeon]
MEDFIRKLTLAIVSGYKNKNLNIERKDARDISEYLLSFFGYNDEVIDNTLFRYDRDVFYSMEEIGIVDTRNYIERLENGKEWRLNTWILRRDNIEKLVAAHEEHKRQQKDPEDFYNEIFRKASMDELKSMEVPDTGTADYTYNHIEGGDKHKPVKYAGIDAQEYLSIFTTMLSPSTKPLVYMAIDYGREYSISMIGEALARSLGVGNSEIRKHINIQSAMDSLVSIGAATQRTATKDGKEVTAYSKVASHNAFELVFAHGIMAMSKHLIPSGITLDDLFSVSVAPTRRAAQAYNVFELVRLLSENAGCELRLMEVKSAIDSSSVKHSVITLSEKGILDYDSYPSSRGKSGTLGYRIIRGTSIEEIKNRGFMRKSNALHALSKTIEFINANVGREVNRYDIAENCGTDTDKSSKYLVLLSNAGVLERKTEWNSKRSKIKANEKTLLVWESTLSWLYKIAKNASERTDDVDPAAIASAIKEDGNYGYLKRYMESSELQNDMKLIFEMCKNGKPKVMSTSDMETVVLNAAGKNGAQVYDIMKSLRERRYDVSYAGTQWHVNTMLRKGLLKKEGKVYISNAE